MNRLSYYSGKLVSNSKTLTSNRKVSKYSIFTDSIEEAEKYLQGRLKFVSKKFREPGNTDEELKRMESKRKKSP